MHDAMAGLVPAIFILATWFFSDAVQCYREPHCRAEASGDPGRYVVASPYRAWSSSRESARLLKNHKAGLGHGSSGLRNSSDLDARNEQADVDDITEQCKLRIAELLSGMEIDDVRKLVEEIEQRLRRGKAIER